MVARLADAARSAAADALTGLVNGGTAAGTVAVYTGAQPASPAAAPTGTLLVTLTLSDPAFAAAAAGVAALGAVAPVAAVATGTAGWFRVADSNSTPILDGEVGTVGKQLNLDSTAITAGLNVTITSGNLTMPAS